MSKRRVVLLLTVVLAVVPLFGQDRTVIDHTPLSCIPATCNHARIATRVVSPNPPRTVRVYFRAADQPTEYYIDMLKGTGETYWAVLPAVGDSTQAVAYRIVVRDAAGAETSTAMVSVPVTTACKAPGLTGDEKVFASNIAIGLTADSQPAVPAGFRCTGIQNVIGTNEVMRPNEDCRQVLVSNPTEGCAGAVVAPGRQLTTAQAAGLVAAGAAVGIGTAIIHENNVVNNKPVSTLRP